MCCVIVMSSSTGMVVFTKPTSLGWSGTWVLSISYLHLPMLSSWMFSRCSSISRAHHVFHSAHHVVSHISRVVWVTLQMVLRKSLSSTSTKMVLPMIPRKYGGFPKSPLSVIFPPPVPAQKRCNPDEKEQQTEPGVCCLRSMKERT